MRTRPQAIPLAMITICKSIHGFPFLSYMSMMLPELCYHLIYCEFSLSWSLPVWNCYISNRNSLLLDVIVQSSYLWLIIVDLPLYICFPFNVSGGGRPIHRLKSVLYVLNKTVNPPAGWHLQQEDNRKLCIVIRAKINYTRTSQYIWSKC